MKPPREFWINSEETYGSLADAKICGIPEEQIFKVREVIELNDKDLGLAAINYVYKQSIPYPFAKTANAFEAGARWMKAKMEGTHE